MDQKRLLLALTVSFGILLVFTIVQEKFFPHPVQPPAQTAQLAAGAPQQAATGAPGAAQAAPAVGPR
jgi:YidC/Oxa1 family membrane protein insertase